MKKTRPYWILGAIAIFIVIILPVFYFIPKDAQAKDDPWAHMPVKAVHVDHKDILQGPFETPQEVTLRCLECHPEAAEQVMATSHWTWESEPFDVPWRDEPVTIGKINQLNNFCISAQGNQKKCMSCHIGVGWQEGEQPFDFTKTENIDCLACHADKSTYAKGEYGNPAEGIDLLAAAQSVKAPDRSNCGSCHFNGGGGNNVKHGDLDESLYNPTETTDVHMGRYDFLCTDCHQTNDHAVKGKLVADNYQIDPSEQVACTDCHNQEPHDDERLNGHIASVACQTCHIPSMAVKNPTKLNWDWSTSGQDKPEDHYTYLKIKGDFVYDKDVPPVYRWSNGNLTYRYLLGDKIDPSAPTVIDQPSGDINDTQAKIMPFKLHVASQPYDTGFNYLLAPVTAGPDGYWTNFDWDNAFELAEPITGLEYSGDFSFAETWMYWPTTHMVQPKENALQCDECHSENGRLDWESLGYPGDPIEWGGRSEQ
jgi:octaheme c-type cytochrome (tetrathionate reductase family)